MSAKIRLSRVGAKGKVRWRVVVQDVRVKRDGKVIELLGIYDPLTSPKFVKVNKERIDFWLGRGAQITPAVKRLIK